jgi:hypothetical protein
MSSMATLDAPLLTALSVFAQAMWWRVGRICRIVAQLWDPRRDAARAGLSSMFTCGQRRRHRGRSLARGREADSSFWFWRRFWRRPSRCGGGNHRAPLPLWPRGWGVGSSHTGAWQHAAVGLFPVIGPEAVSYPALWWGVRLALAHIVGVGQVRGMWQRASCLYKCECSNPGARVIGADILGGRSPSSLSRPYTCR